MDMEDDKVADMVLMIPNEDFSDGTVSIGYCICLSIDKSQRS